MQVQQTCQWTRDEHSSRTLPRVSIGVKSFKSVLALNRHSGGTSVNLMGCGLINVSHIKFIAETGRSASTLLGNQIMMTGLNLVGHSMSCNLT